MELGLHPPDQRQVQVSAQRLAGMDSDHGPLSGVQLLAVNRPEWHDAGEARREQFELATSLVSCRIVHATNGERAAERGAQGWVEWQGRARGSILASGTCSTTDSGR